MTLKSEIKNQHNQQSVNSALILFTENKMGLLYFEEEILNELYDRVSTILANL